MTTDFTWNRSSVNLCRTIVLDSWGCLGGIMNADSLDSLSALCVLREINRFSRQQTCGIGPGCPINQTSPTTCEPYDSLSVSLVRQALHAQPLPGFTLFS